MNMNISALEDLSSDLFVLSIGWSWAHWSPEIFKILNWQDWLAVVVHLRSWKLRILLEDQSIICWWLVCWRDLMADRMRSQVVPSQQTGQWTGLCFLVWYKKSPASPTQVFSVLSVLTVLSGDYWQISRLWDLNKVRPNKAFHCHPHHRWARQCWQLAHHRHLLISGLRTVRLVDVEKGWQLDGKSD